MFYAIGYALVTLANFGIRFFGYRNAMNGGDILKNLESPTVLIIRKALGIALFYLCIPIDIVFAFMQRSPPLIGFAEFRIPDWAHVIGVCLEGLVIVPSHLWAQIHLGSNWTTGPMLRTRHQLVTSGPYAFVRHPMYTGLLAATISYGLMSSNIVIITLFLSYAVMIIVTRLKPEEQLLTEHFPEYQSYRQRTSALFPMIY